MDSNEVIHNFTYHAPASNDIKNHELLRNNCQDLALLILQICPDSRERTIAITKIEEANMWANASIARNKRGE